jgi:predicted O-linked N-acetylglucosamine transferase (SPINDLY family)
MGTEQLMIEKIKDNSKSVLKEARRSKMSETEEALQKNETDEQIVFTNEEIRIQELLDIAQNKINENLWEEGKKLLKEILYIDPEHVDAWHLLGIIALSQGLFLPAEELIKKAIALLPHPSAMFHLNLGNVYFQNHRELEAIVEYKKVIEIDPLLAEGYNNLSNALTTQNRFHEAIEVLLKGIEHNPQLPHLYVTLGGALNQQGRCDEALICYRKSLEIKLIPAIYNSYLMSILDSPKYDAEALLLEHKKWDELFVQPVADQRKTHLPRPKQKIIKIGYISGDFRGHPVGYFMKSILSHHTPMLFEIYCYANNAYEDSLTHFFKGHAHHWRCVTGMRPEDLANLIYSDQIDILVDLAGHSGDNCLRCFSYKPAPIQVKAMPGPPDAHLWIIASLMPGLIPQVMKNLPWKNWYAFPRDFSATHRRTLIFLLNPLPASLKKYLLLGALILQGK